MDTTDLKTFQDVATQGSFAAVARMQDVDPSSVSRTIAGLEAELGFRLFQRSTRQLRLTEAGGLYLGRVAPLLAELGQARDAAAQAVTQPAGVVRVTASVAFGHECLVPLLPLFRAELPEITLELVLSDDPLDLVAHDVDVALRLAPAPKGDVISTRLRATSYRVVASPAYVTAHGAPDTPAQLEPRAVLRMTLPDHRTEWRFRRAGAEVVVPVSGPVLISNALALRAAARDGIGPALLADWMVAGDLAGGTLVDLFPEHDVTATTYETAVWLLYPSRDYLPLKVRAVIDLLKKALREVR